MKLNKIPGAHHVQNIAIGCYYAPVPVVGQSERLGVLTILFNLLIKDILKKMRILDDKIAYALNTSIPTESFKNKVDASSACQDLYGQIQKGHSERENIIKSCIIVSADVVKDLKAAKAQTPDDIDLLRNLKSEQRKLRLLQTELSVEEVIKEKTSKLFTEKCRNYYKPGK